MMDQDQKDAIIRIIMTIFTVKVARANNAHIEKSTACVRARVSVSIGLLGLLWPATGSVCGKHTLTHA
jgi:hypothetical protein